MAAKPSVVVLGGGLSGLAAAYTLAVAGGKRITLLEREPELGGLAGSFECQGRRFPLGYHHILPRDHDLLRFLELIGARRCLRWRRIRVFFRVDGQLYNLSSMSGFWRFPMSASDKLRLLRLMLRTYRTHDWLAWEGRSAADLVDAWASPAVRRAIFEPLTRLRFRLPCAEVSGAWLGARLHYREGSGRLGYIPDTNWTTVLCNGLNRLLDDLGVRIRTSANVTALLGDGRRLWGAVLGDGTCIPGNIFVSTVPPNVLRQLLPNGQDCELAPIHCTAMVSVTCGTRQTITPDFYWMNLVSPEHAASNLFMLNSLNPTIGTPGETYLNFVTHLRNRDDPFFGASDEQILGAYGNDFREVFGFDLKPIWTHVVRIPTYAPVFHRNYQNPSVRSRLWQNLYYAGNYRSFPSVVSTGTALATGLEAARTVLSDHGAASHGMGVCRRRTTCLFSEG